MDPIDRRRLRKLSGLVGASLALATLACTPEADPPSAGPVQPPNILVIQPDQHRAMALGSAGDAQARTPHLDRLAAEGIRFTHAVSSSPGCAPARASYQTGLLWFEHGVYTNGEALDPKTTTVAELFAAHGYATGYIGKWHLNGRGDAAPGARPGFVPPDRRHGWKEWWGYEVSQHYTPVTRFDETGQRVRVEGYDWEPRWQTDVMLDFAARHSEQGRPWLGYLSYGPPHLPAQVPREYLQRFPPADFQLPPDLARLTPEQEAKVRSVWQLYYAQLNAIDDEVGRLLAGLASLGIDRDTLVVYTSDHGDRLGSHATEILHRDFIVRGKASPHATAIRVPLILRWPGRIAPGQVNDVLVGSDDLAPTLLDFAGIPVPASMRGTSLASWALRGEGPRRDALYLGVFLGDRGWRAIWDGRYLLSSGTYRVLYDHRDDPYELRNLRDSPEHRELARDLERRLLALAREHGDPAAASLAGRS